MHSKGFELAGRILMGRYFSLLILSPLNIGDTSAIFKSLGKLQEMML